MSERKTCTIKPIPKIEQSKKASQFRLINMLPTFEKVLQLVKLVKSKKTVGEILRK